MAKKRLPSPTEEDIKRITETLRNTDGEHEIKDFDSFDKAWRDYFEDNPEMRGRNDLKIKSFHTYAEEYPDRLMDIVITKKELKGKERKRVKGVFKAISKPKRELNIVGWEKGKKDHYKVVYTSKEIIKVRGKDVIRHRDRLGRFASVKKRAQIK
jgi:hypothetical protein